MESDEEDDDDLEEDSIIGTDGVVIFMLSIFMDFASENNHSSKCRVAFHVFYCVIKQKFGEHFDLLV